jgi:hypothetical protein
MAMETAKVQQSDATRDFVAGAGTLFLSSIFLIALKGNTSTAFDLAALRGHFESIQRVQESKRCKPIPKTI